MLSTFFPVACSLGSFLTTKLLCSPLNSINLSKARCVINPQPSRGEKTPIKENQERKLKTQKPCCGDRHRLASLNESAPLRRSCQRGRVGALNGSPAGPSALRPPRGRIPSTPGKQRLGRGRPRRAWGRPGDPAPVSGASRQPIHLHGSRGASLRQVSGPGPLGVQQAARILPRPAGFLFSTSSVPAPRPPLARPLTAAPKQAATQPRLCAKPQGRGPHRGGAWGGRGSVCVCSCVCVDADARGAPGGSGGGGLSTPAAYSSAWRQRGRAGQFQEPAAASRALADTGKACDWPAAAPMQTS